MIPQEGSPAETRASQKDPKEPPALRLPPWAARCEATALLPMARASAGWIPKVTRRRACRNRLRRARARALSLSLWYVQSADPAKMNRTVHGMGVAVHIDHV